MLPATVAVTATRNPVAYHLRHLSGLWPLSIPFQATTHNQHWHYYPFSINSFTVDKICGVLFKHCRFDNQFYLFTFVTCAVDRASTPYSGIIVILNIVLRSFMNHEEPALDPWYLFLHFWMKYSCWHSVIFLVDSAFYFVWFRHKKCILVRFNRKTTLIECLSLHLFTWMHDGFCGVY